MPELKTIIALGSNLGESEATLAAATERIASLDCLELLATSSVFSSEPAGFTEQPDFKNSVILVETSLEPEVLLRALQDIEAEFGRVRDGKDYQPNGPRTLDLDIIDIEGIVLDNPNLTLPHPETLTRDFVVTPLLEISPFHVLANGKVVNHNAVTCGNIIRKGEQAEAALSEAASQGQLLVCATPIGNMADITLRVLDALRAADTIYCEDTRVTRKLTSRYEVNTPLERADAHKLPQLLPKICDELSGGKRLVYVSDAGMPGISDPGGQLVAAVREAGHSVEVLPGASALTTALATCGIKAHSHYFGGFFPRKSGAGTRLLEELAGLEDTVLVFYESVHRTVKTLQLIAKVLPARHVVMARELTKLHEEVLSDTAEALAAALVERAEGGRPLKGEVVLLIAPQV